MSKVIHCLIAVGLGISASAQASDLSSTYQDAVKSSPILQQDRATAAATDAGVPIAVGGLLPQLSISANATETNANEAGTQVTYPSDGYTLSATQTLFDYNAFSGVAFAHKTAKAADATYQSQLQSFMLTVAEDYFAVLNAEENVRLSQANLDSLTATYRQTHERFDVGLSTYADVLQAKANQDTAEASLIASQAALSNAEQNLYAMTGKVETPLASLSPRFPFLAPQPNDLKTWVNKALQHNSALLAQQYTAEAALATVNAAVGQQLPKVSLQAQYGEVFYQEDVPYNVSPTSHVADKMIALNLTWTVFNGSELMASSLQAANQYAASTNTTLDLYRQTKNTTTQDFLSVNANVAQVKSYQLAVISAQSRLNDTQAKYKVGTDTIVDVLNATQALYQAQTNLTNAQYQYINSYLALQYDAGLLTPDVLADLNQYLALQAAS